MRYGLIGEKLGHSYSKIIHEKLADYKYDLIPLKRDQLDNFMVKKDFTAINVTIPYKEDVIPYLDELNPLAKEIGAVNTIVNNNGYLRGYNTDFYGLKYLIENNDIETEGKKGLVLGSGGTSKTARAVLKDLGAANIITVSRRKSEDTITYEEVYEKHTDGEIIVNTTPVGMYPNEDTSPLDLTSFSKCTGVVDAIFNPLRTELVKQGLELGIKSVTGLEMLVAQAKRAVEYFLDVSIPDSRIQEVYGEVLEMINH